MAACTGRVPERHDDRTWKRDADGHPITRPCKKAAIVGGRVCASHGGRAPHVRAAADTRAAEASVQRQLGKLAGVLGPATPVDNPLTELSKLAGEVIRWKELLAERVAELQAVRFTDDRGGEQLRAEVALFERALDRCTHVLGTIAKLKIDERLAAISEAQAERVLAAIDAALDTAGVDRAARTPARQAAARHLRATA